MEGLWLTADGGLLVTGSSDSFSEPGDAWVLRTDGNGQVLWQKRYGGPGDESLFDAIQTPEGGFLAVGATDSFGAGKEDMWVVKLDAEGNIEWQKTYGGPRSEQAWSVDITPEGDYLIAGGTTSFGAGKADYLLLKLGPDGRLRWAKTYGGPGDDGGGGVYDEFVVKAQVAPDGNYLLVSVSSSFGVDAEDDQIWALKVSPDGNLLWQKAYGGEYEETMWWFDIAVNGDILLAGSTVSYSPDLSGDVWVLRLAQDDGAIVWQKMYGIPEVWAEALALTATADNGALIAGYLEEANDWDWFLLRLDARGQVLWQERFESGRDWPNAVRQFPDGGFAVAGVSWPDPEQPFDLWLSRLDANGSPGTGCAFLQPMAFSIADTADRPRDTQANVQDAPLTVQDSQATAKDTSGHALWLCDG